MGTLEYWTCRNLTTLKICHQTKIESVEEYINESSLSRQRLNPPSEDKQREMKFRKEFRELVDRIHPHGRPKNQDGDTYTDGGFVYLYTILISLNSVNLRVGYKPWPLGAGYISSCSCQTCISYFFWYAKIRILN